MTHSKTSAASAWFMISAFAGLFFALNSYPAKAGPARKVMTNHAGKTGPTREPLPDFRMPAWVGCLNRSFVRVAGSRAGSDYKEKFQNHADTQS